MLQIMKIECIFQLEVGRGGDSPKAENRNVISSTKLRLPSVVDSWESLDKFVKESRRNFHPIM